VALSFTVLLSLFASPVGVLAHAELDTAVPADGAVLDAPPTEIVLTFTEALDAAKSHMELIGPDGTDVAKGGIDTDNELAMRIDPPDLEPGAYEIHSTAVAAHDGAVARETLTFTITAPSPSPTPTPTPRLSASATPSPSPSASPSPSPSPAPSAGGPASTSGGDVLLPILAAVVVVGILGAFLIRGRSRGGGSA
jgi:copper resistance protein C